MFEGMKTVEDPRKKKEKNIKKSLNLDDLDGRDEEEGDNMEGVGGVLADSKEDLIIRIQRCGRLQS